MVAVKKINIYYVSKTDRVPKGSQSFIWKNSYIKKSREDVKVNGKSMAFCISWISGKVASQLFTSCVTLDKFLNFPELQFLKIGDTNNCNLIFFRAVILIRVWLRKMIANELLCFADTAFLFKLKVCGKSIVPFLQ